MITFRHDHYFNHRQQPALYDLVVGRMIRFLGDELAGEAWDQEEMTKCRFVGVDGYAGEGAIFHFNFRWRRTHTQIHAIPISRPTNSI